jgi:hypothetical protein
MSDADIKKVTGYVEEAELEAIVGGETVSVQTSWPCVTVSILVCPTTGCTQMC